MNNDSFSPDENNFLKKTKFLFFFFILCTNAGMNNNERPEGNFNRNDRNRGNMNQRGPRHWKDNDDGAPPSHKRNRNFDGPKDNNRNR